VGQKSFTKLGPAAYVIKLFSLQFTNFHTKLVLVLLGWKNLPETNNMAYYDNS
jgi:hypothetical protein